MHPHNGDYAESDSTRVRALRGGWTLDQRLDAMMESLDEIKRDQKSITEDIHVQKAEAKLMDHRLKNVETIVYGLCAIVGVAVVGALIALVVKTNG